MQELVPKRTVIITVTLLVLSLGTLSYFIIRSIVKPEGKVSIETSLGPKHAVIGKSVQGRPVETYTYGSGKTHIVFVGGIHGGYEWNGVLLAYNLMDYLSLYPETVPKNLTVTIIPSANPDGVYKIIGKEGRFSISDVPMDMDQAPGRFNANAVDLNRNFDCKWKPEATWQGKVVDAGSAVFSEPEAKALRDFLLKDSPAAVIFWHSQANAVYASQCKDGVLPETINIMNTYSQASGYPAVKTFSSYEVTGAAEDWLASINIPAITVELQTHKTIEWDKNLAGIKALLEYYKN